MTDIQNIDGHTEVSFSAGDATLWTGLSYITASYPIESSSIQEIVSPGSNTFIVLLPTASTFSGSISHMDFNYNGTSVVTNPSYFVFTSSATPYQLSAPITPQGFVGGAL